MAQILEAPNSSYKTGLALGEGISNTLQRLAAGKAREMQVQKLQGAYGKAGLDPALAYLPESVQRTYVSDILRNRAVQNFESILSGGLQPQATTPSGISALAGLQQQEGGLKAPPEALGTPAQPGGEATQPPTPAQGQTPQQTMQPGGLAEFGGRTAAEVRQALRVLPPDLQKQYENRLQHAENIAERRQEHSEAIALKREIKREKNAIDKQTRIDKSNAPYINALDKQVENATLLTGYANEMRDLLNRGNLQLGYLAKKVPGGVLNSDTQRFVQLGNDAAALLAANSGQATGLKINLAQMRKPNIEFSKETNLVTANKMIEEANNIFEKAKIRDQLIEENGGEQPPNLHSLVNDRYEKYEKSFSNKDLPPAQESAGELFIGKNGKAYLSDGKNWIEGSL